MKKLLLCGVLCALGISFAGCDMEVPTSQVGSFSNKDFCQLTGGKFNDDTQLCTCPNGDTCGENVTCVPDPTDPTKPYVCMGTENIDHPRYTCTIKGMRVCFDRITDENISSGYYVECDGLKWGEAKQCPNGNSCKSYIEHDMLYSMECGDCQNDGNTCFNGIKKN